MITWELRYRTQRGVIDNVLIETFTDQEAEAVALGTKHLDEMAQPSVRFVGVRPIIVARSTQYPDLCHQYGQPVHAGNLPARAAADLPDRVPSMSGDFEPGPLAGAAVDDDMSGPAVEKPTRRTRVGA